MCNDVLEMKKNWEKKMETKSRKKRVMEKKELGFIISGVYWCIETRE